MKNTRTLRLVLLAAFLVAAGSFALWRLVGSGIPRAAIAEERANQERMRGELPPPNESAPKRGSDTPR